MSGPATITPALKVGDRVRLSGAAKSTGLYRHTQDRVGAVYRTDDKSELVTVAWDGRKVRSIVHRRFLDRIGERTG